MSEAIISSLITGILALIGVYAANRKAAALMEYRLQQLEEKVNKHNNLIERMYAVEEKTTVLDEKLKVANHRIEDLEAKQ